MLVMSQANVPHSIFVGRVFLRSWPDGKTDAGDRAFDSAAARLLAPLPFRFPLVGKYRKLRASLHLFPPCRRKDSSLSLEPPLLAPHLVGSAGIHAINQRDPTGAAR